MVTNPNTTVLTVPCRTAARFSGLCLGALDQLTSQKKNVISFKESQKRERYPVDVDPKLFLTNLTFLVPEYDESNIENSFGKIHILQNDDVKRHLGIRKLNTEGKLTPYTLDDVKFYWFYFIVYLRENIQPIVSEKLVPIFEGYFIYAVSYPRGTFVVEIAEPRHGSTHLLYSEVGDSQKDFSENVMYHLATSEIIPRISVKTEDDGKLIDKYGNSPIPFGVGCLASNDYQSRCVMVCLPPT